MRADGRRKLLTVLPLGGVLVVMAVLVTYSVTLYEMFCRVTGYGGTTRRAETAPEPRPTAGSRMITIRFEANTSPALPWKFQPVQREMRVRVGERHLAHYIAKNVGGRAITGMATFNVTPAKAGIYFNKIACFCFNQQRLDAGQLANMPVSFFVDPEIVKDRNLDEVEVITLSYTFFKSAKSAGPNTGKDNDEGKPRRARAEAEN